MWFAIFDHYNGELPVPIKVGVLVENIESSLQDEVLLMKSYTERKYDTLKEDIIALIGKKKEKSISEVEKDFEKALKKDPKEMGYKRWFKEIKELGDKLIEHGMLGRYAVRVKINDMLPAKLLRNLERLVEEEDISIKGANWTEWEKVFMEAVGEGRKAEPLVSKELTKEEKKPALAKPDIDELRDMFDRLRIEEVNRGLKHDERERMKTIGAWIKEMEEFQTVTVGRGNTQAQRGPQKSMAGAQQRELTPRSEWLCQMCGVKGHSLRWCEITKRYLLERKIKMSDDGKTVLYADGSRVMFSMAGMERNGRTMQKVIDEKLAAAAEVNAAPVRLEEVEETYARPKTTKAGVKLVRVMNSDVEDSDDEDEYPGLFMGDSDDEEAYEMTFSAAPAERPRRTTARYDPRGAQKRDTTPRGQAGPSEPRQGVRFQDEMDIEGPPAKDLKGKGKAPLEDQKEPPIVGVKAEGEQKNFRSRGLWDAERTQNFGLAEQFAVGVLEQTATVKVKDLIKMGPYIAQAFSKVLREAGNGPRGPPLN